MLQTLYLQRGCLPESLQRDLSDSYQHWNALEDDLLLSDTLQDMHRTFCYQGGKRIVWLLDRFDEACRRLDAQFLNSLRALRDAFKGQLCYVIATRHLLYHLRDLAEIDEFYEIVAGNTCAGYADHERRSLALLLSRASR